MSDASKPPIGSIGWCDLTVPGADGVRDFYRDVVGWTATELDMGGYADYCMNQPVPRHNSIRLEGEQFCARRTVL